MTRYPPICFYINSAMGTPVGELLLTVFAMMLSILIPMATGGIIVTTVSRWDLCDDLHLSTVAYYPKLECVWLVGTLFYMGALFSAGIIGGILCSAAKVKQDHDKYMREIK